MTESSHSPAAKSRIALLLILAVGISILFYFVIEGFVLALVMAAVLAGLTRPVQRRLARLFGGREGAASALTVLLALLMVIVPLLLFLGVLLDNAVGVSEQVEPWLAAQLDKPGELPDSIKNSPVLEELLPYQDRIVQKAGELAGSAASFLANAVLSGATGAVSMLLMLFVTLYGMYWFLKDGDALVNGAFQYTPLSDTDRDHIVATFTSVATATMRGTMVIGIVQGALAGAAFAVVGIEGAVFWGTIMAVLSIIPGIGSALVWVPAVLYLGLTGHPGAAIGLGLWCAVVVGTIDNILRPLLVGRDTKMPDLLVLVTTLGGLALFGAAGLVLGPIVGAMFMTVWSLWKTAADEEAAG